MSLVRNYLCLTVLFALQAKFAYTFGNVALHMALKVPKSLLDKALLTGKVSKTLSLLHDLHTLKMLQKNPYDLKDLILGKSGKLNDVQNLQSLLNNQNNLNDLLNAKLGNSPTQSNDARILQELLNSPSTLDTLIKGGTSNTSPLLNALRILQSLNNSSNSFNDITKSKLNKLNMFNILKVLKTIQNTPVTLNDLVNFRAANSIPSSSNDLRTLQAFLNTPSNTLSDLINGRVENIPTQVNDLSKLQAILNNPAALNALIKGGVGNSPLDNKNLNEIGTLLTLLNNNSPLKALVNKKIKKLNAINDVRTLILLQRNVTTVLIVVISAKVANSSALLSDTLNDLRILQVYLNSPVLLNDVINGRANMTILSEIVSRRLTKALRDLRALQKPQVLLDNILSERVEDAPALLNELRTLEALGALAPLGSDAQILSSDALVGPNLQLTNQQLNLLASCINQLDLCQFPESCDVSDGCRHCYQQECHQQCPPDCQHNYPPNKPPYYTVNQRPVYPAQPNQYYKPYPAVYHP